MPGPSTARLLAENVLARLDRGLEVLRPETGRRGQNDQVDVRFQDLLVSVQTMEAAIFRHGGPFLELPRQAVRAALDAILEGVAECDDLDALVGREAVLGRAAATAAAADYSNLDGLVTRGENARRGKNSCCAHGAGGEEISTIRFMHW